MTRKTYIVLSISIVLIAGGLVGWWIWGRRPPATEVSLGQTLYETNCAVCHGLKGDGTGEAAYLLQPKPRNFRAGKFRLVTSENGQPTRDDLFRTVTNGMPGTAMLSWVNLPESDRLALVDYVLRLNKDGWFDKGIQLGYPKAEAVKYAAEMTELGDPIPVPPEPPLTPKGLDEGRQFYVTACSKCHGEKGEGKQDPTWRTSEGFPVSSRNFRQGVFKGGREGTQLFLRFFTGLPGTPMPSGKLSGEQVWRVVQYVQSLSDPAAQEQAQIQTKEVTVKRVQSLPPGPDDLSWDEVAEVRIPLMPLWWYDGYIDAVRVKIAHDGQRLAFRLEWNDPTRDIGAVRQRNFPDGAAVQLTSNQTPPLFAMGAANDVVNIWHWKAVWDEDRKGSYEVGQAFPHLVSDAYFGSEKGWKSGPLDDSVFIPALHLNNPVARHRSNSIEQATAAGMGTYTAQPPQEQNVEGSSNWKNGVWQAYFVRNLKGGGKTDVVLGAGEKVSAAFAVWQGSASDRNGQKTVSTWNTLTLEK